MIEEVTFYRSHIDDDFDHFTTSQKKFINSKITKINSGLPSNIAENLTYYLNDYLEKTE